MSAEGPRLFLAAEIPDDAAAALHAEAATLAEGSGGRAVPRENLHVTVRFLGTVPVARVAALAAAARSLGDLRAPCLTVTGLVCRPRSRPRLIAAELGDPDAGLTALRDAFTAALDEEDAAGEGPVWPHVTLVRRRGRTSLAPPPPSGLAGLAFTCGAAVLYESVAAAGGSRSYRPVERAPLSPR